MRKLIGLAVAAASVFAGASAIAPAATPGGSAYDFTFGAIEGGDLPLASFRGKVLLVVNTASFCGFTEQYAALQALWTRYGEQGLVVIGVPSNDFGGQEPKGEAEIKSFCTGAFNVTFPLTAKTVVAGAAAHPFYKWAAAAGAPRWNFHKYLIGRDGRIVSSIPTTVAPDAKVVVRAIEAALAAKP